MRMTSVVFENAGRIPKAYTCDNDNKLSPPLTILDAPKAARSFALIMEDPDVPKALGGGIFTHWVVFNIPSSITLIPEGSTIGVSGLNTRGSTGYTGPCPPPDFEPKTHRYFFRLYALDAILDLKEGASREEVEMAMGGHNIATAELMGMYSRE